MAVGFEYNEEHSKSLSMIACKITGKASSPQVCCVGCCTKKTGAGLLRLTQLTVQPFHGFVDGDTQHKEIWLLAEWPKAERELVKYLFCDLPTSNTLRRLVGITKCRWKIEKHA
jgi:hypothetical protein